MKEKLVGATNVAVDDVNGDATINKILRRPTLWEVGTWVSES